jgi:deoxycytidylate deaminase
MANNAVQKRETSQNHKIKTTKEKVDSTLTEELIIGVCSPIGSDSTAVINSLKNRLENAYRYEVECIKISDYILEYYKVAKTSIPGKTDAYTDLKYKIDGGDYLRNRYKNNSILIELAIRKIREDRKEKETIEMKSRRKCYIIDSLKNYEELKLLRSIYGNIFYLFSIFSPESERKAYLRKKHLSDPEIDDIISKDDFENRDHGQNVRDTFVNGDIFIRASQESKIELDSKIERYLHLIFNTKIITPNYHETAMYGAQSAAGNSACLSRQVGATITDEKGVTIARGWNDVPKFGGNLYKDTDEPLHRCLDLGYCSNVTHKTDIFNEIEQEIKIALSEKNEGPLKLLGSTESSMNTEKVMDIIKNSGFKNIIEYSRSIHAEMHAIITGSQMTNSKMVGGNLYCTTYPCHNCARHIILAGIKNIYYIEPYKKSLGIKLHNDALTEDESDLEKVRILPYDGVSPRKYLEFFSMIEERKHKNGKIVQRGTENALPKNRMSLQAIPTLENQAIKALVDCGIIEV